ncbi:MAG: T9SS type A sorting domain-containing protein [candidate division WOR-3 bacterium]|nr:T9SS type A sorting domain-containing protein [candidate division WOR-3 bacterium]
MNKIITVILSAIALLVISADAQLLFQENFSYTAGTNLTANGWTAHSASGTNPIKVHTVGLTFPSYASSGIGLSARVDSTGEDVNRTFTAQTSGTIYTAFMLRVEKAKPLGDYFFHLSTNPLSSAEYFARIHIKSDASNNLAFGLGKRHTDTTFTGFTYAVNTTYLLVVKYAIVSGDNNDQLSLFVFNTSAPATEPATPTVGPISPANSADPANIGSVALRQGQAANGPTVIIDGIRIGTSWSATIPTCIEENYAQFSTNPSLRISPNPFTSYTHISYNGNLQNFKNIKIYDATGNLVKTLTETNSIWDGRDEANNLLSAGIYFIQLETNSERKISKITLLR